MENKFKEFLLEENFYNSLLRRSIKLAYDPDKGSDLFQTTLLKALENKENFLTAERNKNGFDALDVHKWTYKINTNTNVDILRKETFEVEITDKNQKKAELAKKKGKTKERIKRELSLGSDLPILQSEGEQESALLVDDIRRCLKALSLREREVISFVGDLSYKDISEVLEISEANSRIIAFRAKEKLMTCLELEG